MNTISSNPYQNPDQLLTLDGAFYTKPKISYKEAQRILDERMAEYNKNNDHTLLIDQNKYTGGEGGYFAKDIKFANNMNDVMQSIVPRGNLATVTYTDDLIRTFSKAIDSDNSFMVRNEDKDIKDKRGGVDYIRKDVAESELYKNFEPIELGVEASKRFAVDKA
jgi:hypothetical protein